MATSLPVHWHSGSEILDPDQFVEEEGQPRRFVRPDLPAGSARFAESQGGKPYLTYVCPCGCGSVGTLPLLPLFPGEAGWGWDGDRVYPTITPSIQRKYGCRWHGFLTKGVWLTLPQSAR